LSAAFDGFERVDVYDSTAPWSTPRLVATSHDGRIDRLGVSPGWLEKAHTRVVREAKLTLEDLSRPEQRLPLRKFVTPIEAASRATGDDCFGAHLNVTGSS
jgi:hypothetical protein